MSDDLLTQMEPITRHAESRNRDFDKYGRPVRSGAGALYAMQVMPTTAHKPGYGVAPAAADTPAEYNRVGHDLLGALTSKYGDPTAAWAAYNWGPGHVDRAKAAYGEDWLAHAPSSVREYAQGNARQLGAQTAPASGGAPGAVSTMDEAPYPASGDTGDNGGPLSQSEWTQQYQQAQQEAQQNAADKAALRAQQLAQGQAYIDKMYQPPSTADQLYALGAAFLQPTRFGGFKGFMSNMAPALQQMHAARGDAEKQRAQALYNLQQQYGTGELSDRDAAVKARIDLLRTGKPSTSGQQPIWDTTSQRFVPRDKPVAMAEGVAKGVRFWKYSDGTHRVLNPDGTMTVYSDTGAKLGVTEGDR